MSTRAGFHAGEVYGDRIRAGDTIIPISIPLPAFAYTMVGSNWINSGACGELNNNNTVWSGIFSWPMDQTDTGNNLYIAGITRVPKNIPNTTKAIIDVHWTTSSVDGGVVNIGAFYKVVGSTVSGTYLSRAATTGIALSGADTAFASGITIVNPATSTHIYTTSIEIPATKIIENSFILYKICRQQNIAALDSLGAPIRILMIEPQFIIEGHR